MFDCLDPREVAVKCIKLGIRSSIVRVFVDFLNDRKLQVKLNGQTSTSHDLTGVAPEGSILSQLLCIIGSDYAGEDVPSEDKFKYKDDLATLESVQI